MTLPTIKAQTGMALGRAITADGWNEVVEEARRSQAERKSPASVPGELSSVLETWGSAIMVRNSTGDQLASGHIVRLSSPAWGPEYGESKFVRFPVLVGGVPQLDQAFAVVRDPTPNGKSTRAYVAGLAICQVDLTETYHRYADCIDGDRTKLESIDVGPARLLWTENNFTVGVQWAMVFLQCAPPDTLRRVQLTSDMSSQTATFNWLDPSLGGSGLTGHDLDNNYENAVATQAGLVRWMQRKWVFVDLPCEAVTVTG